VHAKGAVVKEQNAQLGEELVEREKGWDRIGKLSTGDGKQIRIRS